MNSLLNKKKLSLVLALVACWSCSPSTPAEQSSRLPAPVPGAPSSSKAPADSLLSYTWQTDACRYTGRYNPRRYTKAQLDGIYELLYGSHLLDTDATANTPADIGRLSLDSLTQEYTRRMQRYRRLQVLPQPVWLTLKRQAIEALEQEYQAKALTIRAFANPSVLLTTSYPGGCTKYVQGLAAQKDSLILKDWQSLIAEEIKRDKKLGDTGELYIQRFQAEVATPEWVQYAKIELLTYGWWNCVNASIQYIQPTAKQYQEFDQLFKEVKSECDDVD